MDDRALAPQIPTMRVLVTGSRDWDDYSAVMVDISALHREAPYRITFVHGDCPTGADRIVDEFARYFGEKVEPHRADWERHGKRAGYLRNAEMVNLGADVCYAYIKDGSKGATMTAALAEKAGIPVVYRRANAPV